MEERFNQRKKDFKKSGVDIEETRRRRENDAYQIRKQEKDDQLAQRRRMLSASAREESPSRDASNAAMPNDTWQYNVALREIVEEAQDPSMRFSVTQRIRKLLSVERNPPIDLVVNAQLLGYLVEGLAEGCPAEVQFESAWALTNIASGTNDQTRKVVNAGAVPHFLRLMGSPNEDVREQVLWALGNIAGDSVALRDLCLKAEIVPRLIMFMQAASRPSCTKTAVWCMSNCCRLKPSPELQFVAPLAPVAAAMLEHSDRTVVTDSCWCLSYLSDGNNDRIQAVTTTGAIPKLVQLLEDHDSYVVIPALRAVGNVVTGTDIQTQTVIDAGGLANIQKLLFHSKRNIRKESVWAISNIAAGTAAQVEAVVHSGVLPRVIQMLSSDEFEVRREAAWVLSNFCHSDNLEHIHYVVVNEGLKVLCMQLQGHQADSSYQSTILDAITLILSAGEKITAKDPIRYPRNPYIKLVEEYDGLSLIESVRDSGNQTVYSKACKILSEYFGQGGSDRRRFADDYDDEFSPGIMRSGLTGVPYGADGFDASGSDAMGDQAFDFTGNSTATPQHQTQGGFNFMN